MVKTELRLLCKAHGISAKESAYPIATAKDLFCFLKHSGYASNKLPSLPAFDKHKVANSDLSLLSDQIESCTCRPSVRDTDV